MPEDINQINLEMKLSKYKSLNANLKKSSNFEKQGADYKDKPWLNKK
jgi:hypothetical protein